MKKLALRSLSAEESRVPHISLVFREMWDRTALDRGIPDPPNKRLRFVESHISRKTSEMWGTQHSRKGQAC
jgi:hypothetical protein